MLPVFFLVLEYRIGKLINHKHKITMATLQQFQDELAKLDAATTAIATTLEDLKAQITNAGISAADEDAIVATLDAAITKLQGLGTPPAAPTA